MEASGLQLNPILKREKNAKTLLKVSKVTLVLWILLYLFVYGFKFSIGHDYDEGTGFGFVMLLVVSYGIAKMLTASSVVCSIIGIVLSFKLEKSILRRSLICFSVLLPVIVVMTGFLVNLYMNGALN